VGKLNRIEELFAGRHFDREVIILCVRWYLRYKLSFRDLVEIMAERGLHLAHTTILRWVRRFAPEFIVANVLLACCQHESSGFVQPW
jgi:transposase-like protein